MTDSQVIHACGFMEGLLLALQMRETEETAGEALLDARQLMNGITAHVLDTIKDGGKGEDDE